MSELITYETESKIKKIEITGCFSQDKNLEIGLACNGDLYIQLGCFVNHVDRDNIRYLASLIRKMY
jgi:hypothetical protein